MADTVQETIKGLGESGVYSALLGFLYELRNDPKYSLLSEISFLTSDSKSCLNILEYFAGKTITFPTEEELAESIQVLRLYQCHEVDNRSWKDSLKIVGLDSNNGKGAKNKLDRFKETIKKYNFSNRNY